MTIWLESLVIVCFPLRFRNQIYECLVKFNNLIIKLNCVWLPKLTRMLTNWWQSTIKIENFFIAPYNKDCVRLFEITVFLHQAQRKWSTAIKARATLSRHRRWETKKEQPIGKWEANIPKGINQSEIKQNRNGKK